MDTEFAKKNMLAHQIRAWGMLDDDILTLLRQVPRERFVPSQYIRLAFADTEIPLGHGQVMLSPAIEAYMLEALNVQAEDKVLEVGTGSGYTTALLAKKAQHVYSIDIIPEFTEAVTAKLAENNITNVTLQTGDAAQGWDKQQPYDVICITGALEKLPNSLLHELKVGGRLFAVIGSSHAMEATLITRTGESTWDTKTLFETVIPPLLQLNQHQSFSF